MTMSVTEAVQTRRSVRAYLDRPVPSETVRALCRLAAQAPSGGNLQPWLLRDVEGERLKQLKALMRRRCAEAPEGEITTQGLLPSDLGPSLSERQRRRTHELVGAPGDSVAEQAFFYENFQFYGAPYGLFAFIDRPFGAQQWLDIGLYLQTVMLLLREAGLDSCYIGAWAAFEPTVRDFLGVPETVKLVCGLAIGYGDPGARINGFVPDRDDPFRSGG
jgi:nitroreductase